MPLSKEKDFLKEIFYTFYPQITPPLGGGVMKFTISCPLTLQMLYTKFGYDWLSNSCEEDVNARRTTDDGRRTTTDANP